MNKNYLVGYKVFFALLGFSAIVTEIATVIARGTFDPGNFFSFFTILANIVAVIMFIISALYTFAGKKSHWLDIKRGGATFYMIVTGIVFAALLSGLEGVELTAVPWDNIVLHYLIPIAVTIDWLIDRPSRKVTFKQSLLWLAFPVFYLGYSLIRGLIAGWYPYPFLNPANGGYEQIVATSLAILVVGVVLAFIVSRFGPMAKTSKK